MDRTKCARRLVREILSEAEPGSELSRDLAAAGRALHGALLFWAAGRYRSSLRELAAALACSRRAARAPAPERLSRGAAALSCLVGLELARYAGAARAA
jgi:hypothetical protein